jgi:hypothetical protein
LQRSRVPKGCTAAPPLFAVLPLLRTLQRGAAIREARRAPAPPHDACPPLAREAAMSLRELVSGAGCSADGASGSGSNPAAGFADALLGGTSKAHEGQLRQLPGAPPLLHVAAADGCRPARAVRPRSLTARGQTLAA